MTQELPWSRYVAIGDSFTEGVGDPEPRSPGGLRGWADRVAEVMAQQAPGFAYANLAIRGRLIDAINEEQIEPALALQPDLITYCAGGNDVIRPGSDADAVTEKVELAARQLRRSGATVVLFTAVDVGFSPVFRYIRGKVAIYNENVRAIAQRHGCLVADQWALTELRDARLWSADRLHMNPLGHHLVARMVLDTLGVQHGLQPEQPAPMEPLGWRRARAEDLVWARQHLLPWVMRRIRHQSSGDFVSAKRPQAAPLKTGHAEPEQRSFAHGSPDDGGAGPNAAATD